MGHAAASASTHAPHHSRDFEESHIKRGGRSARLSTGCAVETHFGRQHFVFEEKLRKILFLALRCAGTTNRFRFRICEVRTCRATCICSFHLLVSDPCIRESCKNRTLKGGVAARDCQQAVLWRRGFGRRLFFPRIHVEWTLKFPRRCAGSFVFHNNLQHLDLSSACV